jgi:hypothetical protein
MIGATQTDASRLLPGLIFSKASKPELDERFGLLSTSKEPAGYSAISHQLRTSNAEVWNVTLMPCTR